MNEWMQLTMTVCPHCNRLITCSPQLVCKLCRGVDKPTTRAGSVAEVDTVVKSRCVGSTPQKEGC